MPADLRHLEPIQTVQGLSRPVDTVADRSVQTVRRRADDLGHPIYVIDHGGDLCPDPGSCQDCTYLSGLVIGPANAIYPRGPATGCHRRRPRAVPVYGDTTAARTISTP